MSLQGMECASARNDGAQVHNELGRLEEAASEFRSLATEVEGRFSAVVELSETQEEAGPKQPEEPLVPLADRIRDIRRELQHSSVALRDIISRCRL